jgi:acyl carrier protein
MSGLLSQKLSEKLYYQDIGSCSLGLIPYKGALYSILIGKIDENDKYLSDSVVLLSSLKQIINQELSKNLPEYMLPSHYVILDEIPLSANGKVDVNKLSTFTLQEHNKYVPPRNDFEAKICQIWSELLNLSENEIGIDNNFFSLGGDSLLAIKLVSKINKELQTNLSVYTLFQEKTIYHLTQYLLNNNEKKLIIDEGEIL